MTNRVTMGRLVAGGALAAIALSGFAGSYAYAAEPTAAVVSADDAHAVTSLIQEIRQESGHKINTAASEMPGLSEGQKSTYKKILTNVLDGAIKDIKKEKGDISADLAKEHTTQAIDGVHDGAVQALHTWENDADRTQGLSMLLTWSQQALNQESSGGYDYLIERFHLLQDGISPDERDMHKNELLTRFEDRVKSIRWNSTSVVEKLQRKLYKSFTAGSIDSVAIEITKAHPGAQPSDELYADWMKQVDAEIDSLKNEMATDFLPIWENRDRTPLPENTGQEEPSEDNTKDDTTEQPGHNKNTGGDQNPTGTGNPDPDQDKQADVTLDNVKANLSFNSWGGGGSGELAVDNPSQATNFEIKIKLPAGTTFVYWDTNAYRVDGDVVTIPAGTEKTMHMSFQLSGDAKGAKPTVSIAPTKS
ncbi:hypothetical protein [Streptomyces klenkii]|uniref:hypothetical protein n=1 Tax=Streptomyces klenkii TaxID=1420899 RepID=UPI0034364FAF